MTALLAACGGGGEPGIGLGSGTGSPPIASAEKSAAEPVASAQDEKLPLPGYADGPADSARFRVPQAIAVDRLGNKFVIDVMAYGDSVIRKITPDGNVSTLTSPTADNPYNLLRWRPQQSFYMNVLGVGPGIVVDSRGALYVSNASRGTIEKVDVDGVVTLFAGVPDRAGNADGPAGKALLNHPMALAIDSEDTIYFTDHDAQRVRKISPAGVVTTIAGRPLLPSPNYSAWSEAPVDGTGFNARFVSPTKIAVDAQKNIYVLDTSSVDKSMIRKITAEGVVTTLLSTSGNLCGSDSNPGGTLGASFDGLAVDAAGNVIVADSVNHVLRKLSPTGQFSTFSGAEYSPCLSLPKPSRYENGPPASARFGLEIGNIAMSPQGDLYVVDAGNHVIRKVDAAGNVSTHAGVRSWSPCAREDAPILVEP
ncbi:hypothetical protein ACEN9J_14095 [Variovorax sp. Varisp41]|uniref:NHL domain-containing protein n=1 Tax=Variovorax sp. Varisp41 TaxID=3243033 RepID=UPI0039B6D82B